MVWLPKLLFRHHCCVFKYYLVYAELFLISFVVFYALKSWNLTIIQCNYIFISLFKIIYKNDTINYKNKSKNVIILKL